MIGRQSPYSLYSQNLASFDMTGYNAQDSAGFIRLFGLPPTGCVTRMSVAHNTGAGTRLPAPLKKNRGIIDPQTLQKLESIEDPVIRARLESLARSMPSE